MTASMADQPLAKPIVILLVLMILSLAPFLLMMTTSFVKLSVVLSLIRSALGTQQIPPNQIVTGLALI
ncbi:MAG: EscR/YscR/HrcR family type III secretion system export apparatus protein, partial [Deltaproteobacteria bacterium]|nr:EscR/YscR/HrcR family type III secretion system export apparatus protein [Deltaproteobacteria bacterium]